MFFFLFIFILALLQPAHALPFLASTPPTWLISYFTLTLTPTNLTTLTFAFHDTSPTHNTDLTCTTRAAYNGTHVCGPNRDLLYKVTEGEVVLRRRMTANSTNMGTARQETNWIDGVNVTETDAGKVYLRDEDWFFPIMSVSG